MWPERSRLPLYQTQPSADPLFSRPKLLTPALKWCLTEPGPPLSSERLQAAPAATGLHPGAGPAVAAAAPRRSWRPAQALRFPPGRPQAGGPAPRRALTCPRPASPRARRGSSASRSAPRRLARAAPRTRKPPAIGRRASNPPQQRRRRLAPAAPWPPRRTRAMLTIRRRGAQPIRARARIRRGRRRRGGFGALGDVRAGLAARGASA